MIDLRSDTVTRPTRPMLDAMLSAELGDDVLGDDPTVARLERAVADRLGKEDAAFVPSGTMANQCAIRALTEPGDEIIADETAHVFHYETGAPAALSGCSIRFARGRRGIYGADDVRVLARPDFAPFPRTRLVVVENTCNGGGGAVWPLERVDAVCAAASELGLACHLDGARLWNAAVASGTTTRAYAGRFDTVSCCFSKGLGAPVGSAVASDRPTIRKIKRVRKMLGGAMRQSGVLAAAALYALEHHVERLGDDHERARALGAGIAGCAPIEVDPDEIETNIVIFGVDPAWGTPAALCRRLEEHGVRLLPAGPRTVRAVTHLDVSEQAIGRAVEAFRRVLV